MKVLHSELCSDTIFSWDGRGPTFTGASINRRLSHNEGEVG